MIDVSLIANLLQGDLCTDQDSLLCGPRTNDCVSQSEHCSHQSENKFLQGETSSRRRLPGGTGRLRDLDPSEELVEKQRAAEQAHDRVEELRGMYGSPPQPMGLRVP